METFVLKEFKQMFLWCRDCPPMKISAAQWALAGSCLFTTICLLVQVADYHVGLFSHDVFLTFKILYLALLCLSLLSTSCSLFASRRPFSTSDHFVDPLSATQNLATSSSIFNLLTKCGCNGLFPRRFVLLIASVLFSLIALAISLTPGTHHDQEDHLAAKQILQVLQTLSVGISVFLNVRAWLHVQNWDKLSLSPEITFDQSFYEQQTSFATTNTVMSLEVPKQSIVSPTTLEIREQNTESNQDGINVEESTKSSEPIKSDSKTTKETPNINVEINLEVESVQCNVPNLSPNTPDTLEPNIENELSSGSTSIINAAISPNISQPLSEHETHTFDHETQSIVETPNTPNETTSKCLDINGQTVDMVTKKPEVKLPHNKPRKITEPYVMQETENLAEKYKLNVLAGTSTLYRYWDNTCIVKVLHENIPQEMFNNEIRFFNHPDFFNSHYLVKLKFYAGSKSKKKYLISEYISPGKDLNRWLYTSRQSLTAIDRFNILVGISEGLTLINNHHIIHNDIKPGNIIIDQNRNPKILDFSSIQPTPHCTLIETCSQVLGTASYMGPERLANKGEQPTTKSDTFSFGVVLLEVLTGRDPAKYHDDDDLPTWVSLYKESGRSLRGIVDPKTDGGWSQVETSVIEDLVDIGLACVNSRPQLRPDMEEVGQKLRQILEPQVSAACVVPKVDLKWSRNCAKT